MIILPVSAQENYFIETFDDPDLPDWEHSPGATVVDGVLRLGPDSFAFHTGEWEDLIIIVRARRMGDGLLQVGFRTTDEGEYSVLIGQDFVALHRTGIELASVPLTIPQNEWMIIEITSEGQVLNVILNGDFLLNAIDLNPLPAGVLVFSVAGDVVGEFDDLGIEQIGQSLPPEEPPLQSLRLSCQR